MLIDMDPQFSRTGLLLGADALERLQKARVAIFGIGGVGGYTAEALARSGVGALDLIDPDTVSVTNINRQLIALHSTIGREKSELMAERLRDINPDIELTVVNRFIKVITIYFEFNGIATTWSSSTHSCLILNNLWIFSHFNKAETYSLLIGEGGVGQKAVCKAINSGVTCHIIHTFL